MKTTGKEINMKNRTFVVTLVGVLMLSFCLAPASHAIIHPIVIALPLAAAFGLAGVGIKAHNAKNHDQGAAIEQRADHSKPPPVTGSGTAGAEAK
ncbi:hypothetical protein D3OALGA1CA_4259 [Olavius algarvensis associated proteobacterium Delta 3]|nr:hypothetical protein D3OALGB2SA_69 [Olavius algarvensis associated proteobacterium Delta 3]CAB5148047.1 hypothetical protein D3OALGA1CA_4259 [Olavius algarvensis associated proteobacterium Delta 3]